MSAAQIPENSANFPLMGRVLVTALKAVPKRQRFMKWLFARVGFRNVTIDYARAPGAPGAKQFSRFALWDFALEGVTNFRTAPFKNWIFLRLGRPMPTFLEILLIFIYTIPCGSGAPRYLSLPAVVLLSVGLQLMSLGLREYVGGIYLETKQWPAHIMYQTYWAGDGG